MPNNNSKRLFYVVRESTKVFSLFSIKTNYLILSGVTPNVISDFLLLNEPENPALSQLYNSVSIDDNKKEAGENQNKESFFWVNKDWPDSFIDFYDSIYSTKKLHPYSEPENKPNIFSYRLNNTDLDHEQKAEDRQLSFDFYDQGSFDNKDALESLEKFLESMPSFDPYKE